MDLAHQAIKRNNTNAKEQLKAHDTYSAEVLKAFGRPQSSSNISLIAEGGDNYPLHPSTSNSSLEKTVKILAFGNGLSPSGSATSLKVKESNLGRAVSFEGANQLSNFINSSSSISSNSNNSSKRSIRSSHDDGILRPTALLIDSKSCSPKANYSQGNLLSPTSANDPKRTSLPNLSRKPSSPEQEELETLLITHPKATHFWREHISENGEAVTLEAFNLALECYFHERVEKTENGKPVDDASAVKMTVKWFSRLVTSTPDSPLSKLFKGNSVKSVTNLKLI